jgi:hypothetical protein
MARVRDAPRARAVTIALGLAVVIALAVPALARAAQSISVTSPTGFPAGGDPTFTTTSTLDTRAGTPGLVTVTLAPGVLASANANPSCLNGPPQYTPSCQIGDGSASTTVPGLSLSFNAYLVPPPAAADVAGIDLVTGPPQAVTHAGVQLIQTPAGNVATELQVDLSQLGDEAQFVSGMTFTVNGTLGGKPFNRMPTNCNPGSTTLTVVYASQTETSTASPDFAPMGCAALPYAPGLSGTAFKDTADNGVAVSTTVTQTQTESASSATTLRLPWPTLSPNLNSLSLLNTSTPVGAATASTPLLPQPLSGSVYFTGAAFTPSLTIRFPPPAAMTLTGSINLNNSSVTFPTVPDVPLTSLVVTLNGGPKSLLNASCAPPNGVLGGTFTSQSGAAVSTSEPLTVVGCHAKPTTSAVSVSGLAAGKPVLRFKLFAGASAPKLKSLSVSLPRALAFGETTHGISITGARTIKRTGRSLVATLKAPRGRVAVRLGAPALIESTQLRRQARRHLVKRMTLHISVTDASGARTSLTAST